MRCKSQLSGRHTSHPTEGSPGQAFYVQSGKGQAWDCGKSNSYDFLEPARQLVPILERLREAGPGPVPGKAGKKTHPRTLWGVGIHPPNQAHQLSLSLGPNGAALCAQLGQGPWVACTPGMRTEIPHLDLSVLRSPGGRGRFQGRWARGACRTAAFGAHSHGYSSAGPFLVETSDFWPLGSWVQTRDGGAQLVGVL